MCAILYINYIWIMLIKEKKKNKPKNVANTRGFSASCLGTCGSPWSPPGSWRPGWGRRSAELRETHYWAPQTCSSCWWEEAGLVVLKGNKEASWTHTTQPDASVPSPAFAERLLCAGPALGAEHRLRTRSVLSPVLSGEMETLLPRDEAEPEL